MKLKHVDIAKLNDGDSVKGFFLCKSFNINFTRLGEEYIDCILENKSGSIRAKVWHFIDEFKHRIIKDMPIAVKGDIITFNNALEVKISSINIVNSDIYNSYGYDANFLIKSISDNKETLFKKLQFYIDSLESNYKKITKNIIKDNYEKVISYPSIDRSYDLNGGLLKQIVSVLDLNKKISSKYIDLDNHLVQAGIILKNIGCIHYFNDDLQYSISNNNKRVGFKLLGINIVNDYSMLYTKFSQTIKTQLQNIILSEKSENDVNVNYINSIYGFDLSIKQFDKKQ